MCSRKCFRMPTLIICGVVLTIVLVCITGITLTNSINISNIVKLREKVASDSAAANGGHQAAQTRAALVEQQYSTLQQHHMSKSDLNYISAAAAHPKNLQRFLATPTSSQPDKIVIEIGLRSSSSSNSGSNSNIENGNSNGNNNLESSASGSAGGISLLPMPHMLQAADALMEGNVDSISLPAAAVAALAQAAPITAATTTMQIETTTTTPAAGTTTVVETTSAAASTAAAPPAGVFGITDHNPAGIQFDRRAHVKQVKMPAIK